MNWLDFVFIAILVVGALIGMRLRLIGALFIAVGVLVGWLLAGQWSDDIGNIFSDSLSNDTLVTVISYAVIIVAAVIASNFAKKIIRPLLAMVTLGLSEVVDKFGGLALGLIIGAALSGALIVGLARLTYNFDTGGLEKTIPEQLSEQFVKIEHVKEKLQNALVGSELVPVFIDFTELLPANALGYVPSDFRVALGILKKEIV